MDSFCGVLPVPFAGARVQVAQGKARVEYRKTEEADLVRRVQARDEMAFRELVERYQSKVFSIIYGILRNHNDAEDIAQQVFAKVYFSINNFDFRSSLLTWIYKITVNECYDYLRKKRVRKLVYESDFSARKTPSAWKLPSRPWIPPSPIDTAAGAAGSGRKAALQGFRRGSQSHDPERSGGPLGRGIGRHDRHEREYDKGKVVPDPPEAAQGGATSG